MSVFILLCFATWHCVVSKLVELLVEFTYAQDMEAVMVS